MLTSVLFGFFGLRIPALVALGCAAALVYLIARSKFGPVKEATAE